MTWTRPWTAVGTLALVLWLATAAQPALADTATFSNNTPTGVCLNDFGTPYPSTIDVSGMNGPTSAVTVTLGQYFSGSTKVDILLVSPTGNTVLVMSDVQSEGSVDITLDDTASQFVPATAPASGSYKPTNVDAANPDAFSGGAPAEPYGAAMSALYGSSPNGTWKLYVAENTALGMPPPCSSDGNIATWSINITTTPPTTPPPGPQPPTDPQPSLDPTAPVILSAEFSKPPVAGQQAFLQVVARDPDSRISGLMVDFGEALGLWAESACIEGQPAAGGTVQFDVPYRYLTPGSHTITITVLSGGCGQSQATQQTKTVTVAAAAAASRRARASVSIPGPTVTSKCKNARMSPTRVRTKAILKALLCVMNEQRKLFKLKPLKNSKRLSKAALAHTRAMILGGFFAHQGPTEPALISRLKKVKFVGAAGENLGAGAGSLGTPVAMVDGWMHSPLHRANLLEKHWGAVGIGFLAQYPIKTSALPVATYTTDFGPKP